MAISHHPIYKLAFLLTKDFYFFLNVFLQYHIQLHEYFNGILVLSFLHPDLGSSFWGMALILASTNLLTARIAAGCLGVALLVVLFVAKNVRFKSIDIPY